MKIYSHNENRKCQGHQEAVIPVILYSRYESIIRWWKKLRYNCSIEEPWEGNKSKHEKKPAPVVSVLRGNTSRKIPHAFTASILWSKPDCCFKIFLHHNPIQHPTPYIIVSIGSVNFPIFKYAPAVVSRSISISTASPRFRSRPNTPPKKRESKDYVVESVLERNQRSSDGLRCQTWKRAGRCTRSGVEEGRVESRAERDFGLVGRLRHGVFGL